MRLGEALELRQGLQRRGHRLGDTGVGNGSFTTGQAYNVDTINAIPIFKDGFENPPAP